jgi:hypothetical protein
MGYPYGNWNSQYGNWNYPYGNWAMNWPGMGSPNWMQNPCNPPTPNRQT